MNLNRMGGRDEECLSGSKRVDSRLVIIVIVITDPILTYCREGGGPRKSEVVHL